MDYYTRLEMASAGMIGMAVLILVMAKYEKSVKWYSRRVLRCAFLDRHDDEFLENEVLQLKCGTCGRDYPPRLGSRKSQ